MQEAPIEEQDESETLSEDALKLKADRLRELLEDERYRSRLHPLEVIIAQSVAEEYRHLRCGKCHKWIDALVSKMEDIEADEESFSVILGMLKR